MSEHNHPNQQVGYQYNADAISIHHHHAAPGDERNAEPPQPMHRPHSIPEEADQLEFMSDEYVEYMLVQMIKYHKDGDASTMSDGWKKNE